MADVVKRAQEAGVVHAVVVGLLQKPGDFGQALAVAQMFPHFLTPTIGIHPHDAAVATEADWQQLDKLAAQPEVKAVGETGLDYFYEHSPRREQEEGFRRQCMLAKRLNKPIVIHVRDAHDDCAAVLKDEAVSGGMIHCFTGNKDDAKRYLDLGFFLSISGVVTYKKTEALQEAVKYAPLERLMVETDSPYLAPAPHRGQWPNEPRWVGHTASKIAELHGRNVDEVALVCAHNSVKLFGLSVAL